MLRNVVRSTTVKVVLLLVVSAAALWYGRIQASCHWDCVAYPDLDNELEVYVPGYGITVILTSDAIEMMTAVSNSKVCSGSKSVSGPYLSRPEPPCIYPNTLTHDPGANGPGSGSFALTGCTHCT